MNNFVRDFLCSLGNQRLVLFCFGLVSVRCGFRMWLRSEWAENGLRFANKQKNSKQGDSLRKTFVSDATLFELKLDLISFRQKHHLRTLPNQKKAPTFGGLPIYPTTLLNLYDPFLDEIAPAMVR